MGRKTSSLRNVNMPDMKLPFTGESYDEYQLECLTLALKHNEDIDIGLKPEWFTDEASYLKACDLRKKICSHVHHEGNRITLHTEFKRGSVCVKCMKAKKKKQNDIYRAKKQSYLKSIDEWFEKYQKRHIVKRDFFEPGALGDELYLNVLHKIQEIRKDRKKSYEIKRHSQ